MTYTITYSIEQSKTEIEMLLESIKNKVNSQYQGQMNWGHAGDLSQVVNMLKEVDKFLG